jgi:hypothetical protein
MRGGEIKRACIDTPWKRQKTEFAEFVLSSLIAAFEDYTSQLAEIGVAENLRRRVSKSLQFPSSTSSSSTDGFVWAISTLRTTSIALTGVFRNECKAHKRYSGPTLANLLICFRFFKCIRNMLAHNGGRADQETVDAYTICASG